MIMMVVIGLLIFLFHMFFWMFINKIMFSSGDYVVEEGLLSPFECGFDSFHEHYLPFSSQFFSVGLVFLMVDGEVCLLLPFHHGLGGMSHWGGALGLFLVFFFLGVAYEGFSGMLDWKK